MYDRPPSNAELLEANGRRIVRRAVATDGPLCDAIMALAMGSKMAWSPAELDELNAELDRCNDSIREWRAKRWE